MKLPRVYPVVDSAAWVQRLSVLGVRLIQLRIKQTPAAGVREEIRRAQACCVAAGMQLIVNDYWQLAIELQCDFVHLGQCDLDDADVTALRRRGIRLGVSTHDERELERALSVQPD